MKKLLVISYMILLIFIITSCNKSNIEDSKIIVAVGIVPQATFVEKIAGDLVTIVTLIPPGNSPANYQPLAKEMQKLSNAKIYFTMQMPTEEANILPKVKDFNEEIKIINLRDIVSLKYPLITSSEHNDEEHGVDPHIWLSPKRTVLMVQEIANELSILDPTNKEIFQKNAKKYIEEINDLDKTIKETTLSMNNKSFLIYHGSYLYFADDYNLKMIAIEIEGKKATAKEMQHVIDTAKNSDIKVVLYQEEFDDTQARTIAREIGGQAQKVSPLSPNYIESMIQFANALMN